MRTTIELREDHRAMLHAIASERAWRGYSRVVEEAIEFYLKRNATAEEARRALRDRKGSWPSKDADRTREAVRELRARCIFQPE